MPPVELDDQGKPIQPKARRYANLTGEQYFTQPYSNTASHMKYINPYYQEALEGGQSFSSMAETYAGIPVVSGYYEGDSEEFIPETSLYPTASALGTLKSTELPTFDEWLGTTGQEVPEIPDVDLATGDFGTTKLTSTKAAARLELLTTGFDPSTLTEEQAVAAGFATLDEAMAWLQGMQTTDLTTSPEYARLQEMVAAPYEGADILTSTPYEGLTDLAELFMDPEADWDRILEEQARAAGFPDVASYDAWRTSTREELSGGIMGQQGIEGTEYEQRAQRQHSAQVQNLIDSNMQMVEALGTTSSAAAYAKMGEISSQIANDSLAFDVKMLEADMVWKEMEYNALVQRRDTIIAQANDGGKLYAEMLLDNRMGALQTFATQITAIDLSNKQGLAERQQEGVELERVLSVQDQENDRRIALRITEIEGQLSQISVMAMDNAQVIAERNQLVIERQQLLDERSALRGEYLGDMEVLAMHADLVYKTIMTQMGYDEHQMNMLEGKYNQFMAPYWEQLETWYQDETIRIAQEGLDLQYLEGGYIPPGDDGDDNGDDNGERYREREKTPEERKEENAKDLETIFDWMFKGAIGGATIGAGVTLPLGGVAAIPGAIIGGVLGLIAGLFIAAGD